MDFVLVVLGTRICLGDAAVETSAVFTTKEVHEALGVFSGLLTELLFLVLEESLIWVLLLKRMLLLGLNLLLWLLLLRQKRG